MVWNINDSDRGGYSFTIVNAVEINMPKKNLLIVVNYYDPYISGVSEYARSLAGALKNHFNVTVLTGQHQKNLKKKEKIDGYTVIRCNPAFFIDKGYISFEFLLK